MDFDPFRVLVADDDDTVRDMLAESLSAMGFPSVDTACNGEEALEALEREPYDLILLDLAMPKIRGEDVVEVAQGRFPDLIIIVITGFATLEKAVTLMKKGIYDLIRKPFNPFTLTRKIQSALQKRDARKRGAADQLDFGPFELLEEVSRGGSGAVWKARERETGDIVALKILLAGKKATDEQVLRFHREATTIAELRHPHIVSIRRVGAHEGKHYIAMDFIAGQPLDTWIEYKDPSLRKILEVLIRTGSALHYAHEREILHRDLKPSNILVDEDLNPHIIDFGIAKSLRDDLRITDGDRLHGTIGYIAPERFAEKDRTVDIRSDVFSLGVILYEVLTGAFPFRLLKECDFLPDFSTPPMSPGEFRSDIPPQLADTVLKAIALKPADRFPTAMDLVEALKLCL